LSRADWADTIIAMEAKPRRQLLQGGAILLFILFVAYPLSMGPAALMINIAGRPARAEQVGASFYYPLTKLPGPIFRLLNRWKDFCINLGPPMKKRAY
jgi:hypothetical protein